MEVFMEDSKNEKNKGKSKRKLILPIVVLCVLMFAIIIFAVGKKSNNQLSDENTTVESTYNFEDKDEIRTYSDEESKILKENIENYRKQKPDSVRTEPRVWYSEENANTEYKENLLKQLDELYDEVNKEDDDNPFSEVNTTNPVDKGPAGNSGLGANKIESDRPQEYSVVCIGFDYGSYLSNNDIRIENFLNGSQSIKTSEDLEYAEISLALDDMVKKLPKEKRNKAVFAVTGYTDTSFRNGKSDVGEESRAFNTELSLKRAKSIKKILVEQKNIDEKRIIVDGRGFEDLVHIKGSKTEDHSKSRRAEVYCYEK